MRRSYLFFGAFALLTTSPSFGQYVPAIKACNRDLLKFCAGGQQGTDPLAECVKMHFEEFNESCKAALVKIAAVRDACRADVQKQCATLKPGAGRILLCVKQHFVALSEPCKDAIGYAAERKVGAY